MCASLFSRFVRNGTRYVPTHLTRRMEAYAHERSFRDDPRGKFVPRLQWTRWNNDADGAARRTATPEARKAMLDFYTKGLEITGAAHRAGVKVLLGTDAGDSYVFPGFAVHDELQELVKAGLSPAEALRAATWEPTGRCTERVEDSCGRLQWPPTRSSSARSVAYEGRSCFHTPALTPTASASRPTRQQRRWQNESRL